MEESLDVLLLLLPGARRAFCEQELNRFVSERRKMEWLSVRVLLYSMLQEDKEIGYSPEGKPYLTDHSFFISISHTKGYVAVIFYKRPTGIDIEYRSDRILKIRSRFMNPEEEAGIDLEHEVEHLLIHWCAKETLFKIIGQEGVDFQKHLHVNPFPYLSSGTFKGRETRTEACREYELAYQVTPDYVLTWLK